MSKEANKDTKAVFVQPSAGGPKQNPHVAQEGVVTNPGVRTVPIAGQGPVCPSCKESGSLTREKIKGTKDEYIIKCKKCGYNNREGVQANQDLKRSGVRIVSPRGSR